MSPSKYYLHELVPSEMFGLVNGNAVGGKKPFFGSRNSRFVGSEVFKTTQSYKDAHLRCH